MKNSLRGRPSEMSDTMNDRDFLNWIYDRLRYVHGDHHLADFMLRLRDFIDKPAPEWLPAERLGEFVGKFIGVFWGEHRRVFGKLTKVDRSMNRLWIENCGHDIGEGLRFCPIALPPDPPAASQRDVWEEIAKSVHRVYATDCQGDADEQVKLECATSILRTHFGPMQQENERLRKQVDMAREYLENIVCTDGADTGVIYLSDDSPTHYDPDLNCQVYDHENFSPLGDGLVNLHRILKHEQHDSPAALRLHPRRQRKTAAAECTASSSGGSDLGGVGKTAEGRINGVDEAIHQPHFARAQDDVSELDQLKDERAHLIQENERLKRACEAAKRRIGELKPSHDDMCVYQQLESALKSVPEKS